MPITTISWLSSSIPADALPRPDHSAQLTPMSASDSDDRSISASATAAPSALAARDRPMDFSVSRVATFGAAARQPRRSRCGNEQRAFDLDEMHVGRDLSMPASAMAARTPAAT